MQCKHQNEKLVRRGRESPFGAMLRPVGRDQCALVRVPIIGGDQINVP